MKKAKIISETTTNRRVYNVSYKHYLEGNRLIHCSRCPYHGVENFDGGRYWGRKYYDDEYKAKTHLRYPNWKLVSKNPKQWMDKPMKTKITMNETYNYEYVEFLI